MHTLSLKNLIPKNLFSGNHLNAENCMPKNINQNIIYNNKRVGEATQVPNNKGNHE